MALTQEETTDLINVIGPFKIIEIRTTTRIKDNGVIVADNLSRDNIKIGDLNSKNELVLTDISSQSTEVQAIAAAVWTDAVKESYRQHLIANLPEGFTP
tara:strand:+ start:622 stop:918 length:297 start_codon:yes stop_codon:yes gene_type:complete